MCRVGHHCPCSQEGPQLQRCPLSAQGHCVGTPSRPSAVCIFRLHMLGCPPALSCCHAASGLRSAHGLQDASAACIAPRPVDSAEGRGGR